MKIVQARHRVPRLPYSIKLNSKDYDVNKGAGVYLAPSETATIEASDGALKLFVLVVPKSPK